MQDSKATHNIGQKAAQLGYTTLCLNWAMFKLLVMRESVLYLLPSKTPDATDFSANRFDKMLDMSPILANAFSQVKNVGSKRAGGATIYIRGANSRKGLKSIDTGNIVYDEFDEMPEANMSLAAQRSAGQKYKQDWKISTPRFPNKGINAQFLTSTQEHYLFPCPACSRRIELKHENLVVTGENIFDPKIKESYIKCILCNAALTNPNDDENQYAERKSAMLDSAAWEVFGTPNPDLRGFYINQLYSPTVTPLELATIWLKAQTSKFEEQEYHNSCMGDAHEVEGARILDDDLVACTKAYSKFDCILPDGSFITMGVDVGTWLHYEICKWTIRGKMGNDLNAMAECAVIAEGKVPCTPGFTNLDPLMRQFQVRMAVVDHNPERSSAVAFAKRFWGHVFICTYGKVGGKSLSIQQEDFRINVDRTMWLDMSLGRFRARSIRIPRDTSIEYKQHLKAIFRTYTKDSDGNPVGGYENNSDDHFAHARNYCEIALPLAASVTTNRDIGSFL